MHSAKDVIDLISDRIDAFVMVIPMSCFMHQGRDVNIMFYYDDTDKFYKILVKDVNGVVCYRRRDMISSVNAQFDFLMERLRPVKRDVAKKNIVARKVAVKLTQTLLEDMGNVDFRFGNHDTILFIVYQNVDKGFSISLAITPDQELGFLYFGPINKDLPVTGMLYSKDLEKGTRDIINLGIKDICSNRGFYPQSKNVEVDMSVEVMDELAKIDALLDWKLD